MRVVRRFGPQLCGMAIALIAVAALSFGPLGILVVVVVGLAAEVRYRARHRAREAPRPSSAP